MAERWQQWMPFHIDKFRGSPEVQAMHPAGRMGYLYLLASAWQTDDSTISAEPMDLATESGLGDELWALYGPRILRKFHAVDGGRLRNDVVFEEWSETKRVWEEKQMTAEERAELAIKRRAAGIAGNEKRWSMHRKTKQVAITGSQNVATCDESGGKWIASDRLTGTGTDTSTGTSASTLAVTSTEVPAGVFELPLPGEQGEWSVPQTLFDEFVKLYPDVSVMEQLAKMRAWLLTNPRKTAKGLPRFMNNWLGRAQNNSPRTPGGNTHAKPNRIDAILESTNATLAARRSGGMDSQTVSDRGGANPVTTARSLFERPHAQLVAKNPG